MFRKLTTLALAGAAPLLVLSAAAQAQISKAQMTSQDPTSNMSMTCKFTSGPRAGSTVDLSGTPGVKAVHIGDHCSDGARSSGVAVAPGSTGETGRYPPSAHYSQNYSTTCRFNSGPLKGTTQDLGGKTGVTPSPLGSSCSSGSSKGVTVSPDQQSQPQP
jgi:hypothetical protein